MAAINEALTSTELRRRVQSGLNKGEAKNALARAVFFNRLGEMRDRSFENQRYRASGLTLVLAAIILWNTVYLSRAIQRLKAHGLSVGEYLLEHLSPLGWEHINLTGDYVWRQNRWVESRKFRPFPTRSRFLTYDFFRFVRWTGIRNDCSCRHEREGITSSIQDRHRSRRKRRRYNRHTLLPPTTQISWQRNCSRRASSAQIS